MIERYIDRFRKLRVNRQPTLSLHKPCMLLAVIELAERGELLWNEIRYAEPLLSIFERYVRAAADRGRSPGAFYPFFYLKNEGFWRLHPKPGRDAALDKRRRVDSEREVTENISHATLDPGLHALLLDPVMRRRLRAALLGHWFADRPKVEEVAREAADPPPRREDWAPDSAVEPYSGLVRDDPFRQRVIEAYDYRCAATGLRVVVPGSRLPAAPLIEAVRLMPQSTSPRGDVRYGIALSPTWGRALQSRLIAPGPDMKWHVSRILDARIADNAPVLDLAGRDIVFTGDRRNLPARSALAWCMEHLRMD